MRRRPSRSLVRAVGVVLVFAVVGVLLGVLWVEVVWSPALGQVSKGTWYPFDERSLSRETAGTSSYVLVAGIGGLVLGLLAAAVSARAELVVLAAVVVGGAVAACLMWWVGTTLGPADPATLAASVREGTELPGDLSVDGLSPFLVLPTTALAALATVWFLSPEAGRGKSRPAPPQDG